MENKFGGGIDLSRYTSSNFPIQQQKLMSTMSLRIINYLPAGVTLLVQGIRLFMTMCFGRILREDAGAASIQVKLIILAFVSFIRF